MRLDARSCFAFPSLLRDGIVRNTVIALEYSLFYQLPKQDFQRLCKASTDFQHVFAIAEADRLRHALDNRGSDNVGASNQDLLDQKLGALLRRSTPITAQYTVSIGDAVKGMVDGDVSSLMLCDGDTLVGIITDKDLRRRVLGKGVDITSPVHTVMTPAPITITADQNAFDAMLAMTEGHLQHLPLVDEAGVPVGLIGLSDLMGA